MNVVERMNPSGRMGKLEEAEAGGGRGSKGRKERRRRKTPGGVWWKGGGPGLAGVGLGDGGRLRIVWGTLPVRSIPHKTRQRGLHNWEKRGGVRATLVIFECI